MWQTEIGLTVRFDTSEVAMTTSNMAASYRACSDTAWSDDSSITFTCSTTEFYQGRSSYFLVKSSAFTFTIIKGTDTMRIRVHGVLPVNLYQGPGLIFIFTKGEYYVNIGDLNKCADPTYKKEYTPSSSIKSSPSRMGFGDLCNYYTGWLLFRH